jgi:hypothetical protein
MTQQPVLLQLPEELYERVQEIAAKTNRPLESVLVDSLALLFGELPLVPKLSPDMLQSFTDAELWAIVARRLMNWPQDIRLTGLTLLGKQRNLSEDEQDELEILIEQWDQSILFIFGKVSLFS